MFRWGNGYATATNWVGVVQVPGAQVEVVPKIEERGAKVDNEIARGNLIYMLGLAGDLQARDRGTAGFQSTAMPLLDVLARMFAERLRRELLRGADSSYIAQEENLRRFRGKLLTPVHLRENAARQDRVFCRFDEFSPDTTLNRVFKATCRILLRNARANSAETQLRQCLLLLEGVEDAPVAANTVGKLLFNRQNNRFASLFEFARVVLQGRAPSLRSGEHWSFALSFDMNVVFERFVGEFLRRRVDPEIKGMIVLQARNARRPLMRDVQRDLGVFRLQPDVLISGRRQDEYPVLLDTKWKVPTRGMPSLADAYQMYAYLDRYESERCVLLYPKTADSAPRDFERLSGKPDRKQMLQVRFVDLAHDLRKEKERGRLAKQLRGILDGDE